MKDTVAVLMSSYNGAAFIKEQVESIYFQQYDGEIILCVRDDGSCDRTCDILRSLQKPENRKLNLCREENIGIQKSFLSLIRRAPEADYYFFSDQDDVWDSNKVAEGVALLRGNRPLVFCSNYREIDSEGNILKKDCVAQKPQFSPLQILFYNRIPGCTIGFNRAMMEELRKLKIADIMMHDSMVLSLASMIGEIVYYNRSLVSHRIHSGNAVGNTHKKIVFRKWIRGKLRLLFYGETYSLSEMAGEFLCISEDIRDRRFVEDMMLLRDYKTSIKKTLLLLKHSDSQGAFWDRTTLSVRCRIIFHIY